jgi:hypothetical protein
MDREFVMQAIFVNEIKVNTVKSRKDKIYQKQKQQVR